MKKDRHCLDDSSGYGTSIRTAPLKIIPKFSFCKCEFPNNSTSLLPYGVASTDYRNLKKGDGLGIKYSCALFIHTMEQNNKEKVV